MGTIQFPKLLQVTRSPSIYNCICTYHIHHILLSTLQSKSKFTKQFIFDSHQYFWLLFLVSSVFNIQTLEKGKHEFFRARGRKNILKRRKTVSKVVIFKKSIFTCLWKYGFKVKIKFGGIASIVHQNKLVSKIHNDNGGITLTNIK